MTKITFDIFQQNIENLRSQFPNRFTKICYQLLPGECVDENPIYEEICCNDNNNNNNDDDEFINSENLEMKMFAMDNRLLIFYFYLTLKYKFFQMEFISNGITNIFLQNFLPLNRKNNQLILNLINIHSTFKYKSIMYNFNGINYPWNDRILPILEYSKISAAKGFNNFGIFSDNLLIPIEPRKFDEIDLFDKYDKIEIKKWAELYSRKSSITTNESTTMDILNSNDFNEKKNPFAVSVTGTACVGKTTILHRAINIIRNEDDENAKIYKAGKLGGFVGKDTEQILAMCYQYTMMSVEQTYYTSILDRCCLDNLIWRFIMTLMNSNESMVDTFMKELPCLTPLIITFLSKHPIIFIIDTNVNLVRKRMKQRGMGNDLARAQIENYVPAQNMVYGVLAKMSNSILIDLATIRDIDRDSGIPMSEDTIDAIVNLIVKKIKHNINLNGLPKEKCIDDFKSSKIQMPNFDYNEAIQLQMFK